MNNRENEKLLDDAYSAWCRKDVDALVACFSDDVEYEDMAMQAVMRGKTELTSFAHEVYKTMPDFHVKYTKRFATDTHGAGQWVITATWNGEFEGVDCTGKVVEFTGLSYYRFLNGKITHAQDCWNYAVMMKTFGVLSEDLRALG